MTGPVYPPQHDRSSSPGGQLPITEQLDYWTTVLSQFANSAILTEIIASIAANIDQRANFDAFYELIWNVDTAQGYGLDVWGRIVGVNRVLKVQSGAFLGFREAYVPNTTSVTGFDDVQATDLQRGGFGPFFSGSILTDAFRLADEAYRRLIFAKAAANITDGSIPAINQILLNLFPGRGNCYVTEIRPATYFGFAEATVTRPTYIRGFNRFITYDGPFLGFGEAVPGDDALGQVPFYSGSAVGLGVPTGVDTAPFYGGEPNPYMAMTYTFDFSLTPVELAIVQQSGVLPKPTGVAASVVVN